MTRVDSKSEPAGARSGVHAVDTWPLATATLEALGAAVAVVDGAGRIEFANERACRVLGRSWVELAGTDVGEVLAPLEDLVRVTPGSEARTQCSIERSDGTVAVVGFTTTRVGAAGSQEHYAVVFQDITEWERLRDERDRLMRLGAVSDVLPSVFHELKNPLAAIATAVELLIEESESPHFQTELHAVLTEMRRVTLTLDGIGAVGRDLRSGRYAAVDHALRETFLVVARQGGCRGIQMKCEVPDMPLLPFDASVVRAVAFNLLTNSLHACRAGESIALHSSLESGVFELEVNDTGKGMTPEVRARCTELFFTTKARGSGIGLALCARVARAAGGTLAIASTPRHGTRITLRIPVAG